MTIPDIVAKLDEQTARRIKSWPQSQNRASEAGHPCVRYLVLGRVSPELKTLHDVSLQRIFDEGNLHETALTREIEDAGFVIVEQQRPYRWERFQLTGRIDGKLALANGDSSNIHVPLELKSCSPNVFPSLRDMQPAEMIHAKQTWIRKYPAQILLYMLMEGAEYGIMLFKNKTTGEKIQKIFQLDGAALEYAESILKKLELVNGHIAAHSAPEPAQIEECRSCPFVKTACFPGQDYGPGFEIMTNEEVEAKLERRESLKAAADEYDEIDKEIKDQFRGRTAIVGDWKIESRPYELTQYEIPKEIKGQYAVKKQGFRTSIEKL